MGPPPSEGGLAGRAGFLGENQHRERCLRRKLPVPGARAGDVWVLGKGWDGGGTESEMGISVG